MNSTTTGRTGAEHRYRIGVDIGGTFTDFVLLDLATGALHNEKCLTTPDDPSRAVLEGIARLMQAHGVRADQTWPGDLTARCWSPMR
ncbi:MAG: hydantoinase/oxoprolinase N-terminal domain-containing protein [Burkholderiaceae bacterium]